MIFYYGYTISPNQLETGEGFLICKNVPVARTGTMEYLASEIGLEGSDIVTVNRTEEEVFSPAAMASFEGKPVTNDHPTELVTPDNVSLYEKGHIQNVRRGSGEFENFLVGDLHVHDAELIKAIKDGKRQISCGYECEYIQDEEGNIYQTKIRGNHVAVVDEGRAGVKAAIMDSINNTAVKAERTNKMSKKSTLLKFFGLAANGKSDEELTKLALDAADALEAEEAPEENVTAEEEAKVEEEVKDEASGLEAKIDALTAAVAKLVELMTPAEPEKAESEVEVKEDIDAAIEELEGKEEVKTDAEEAEASLEGEEAVTVPAEEMDEETEDACGTKDAALDEATRLHILKAVRGTVAGISDEAERKAVSDAIIGAVSSKKSDIENIFKAQASQKLPSTMSNDAVQAAYRNMNPHTREKED